MTTWLRILFLFGLAAVLTGCGVRSAYNNLDWLAMRWLNQQISLNAEQELMARDAIDRKLAWHCESELPAYIEFIERVDSDVASDNISVARLEAYGEEVAGFGRRLLDRARPSVIELLTSLSDEQVAEIAVGINERNEELIAEAQATPEERRERRVESMERGMRRFLGRLSSAQRARLEQWAGELQPTLEFDRARREARDQRFIEALEVRHDEAAFVQRMEVLFEPESSDTDEVYERRSAHNRARTLEALVDIHRLADRRQIDRLRDRLDDLADDFRKLSCQAQS